MMMVYKSGTEKEQLCSNMPQQRVKYHRDQSGGEVRRILIQCMAKLHCGYNAADWESS